MTAEFENKHHSDVEPPLDMETPGEQLKAARKLAKLSEREVAETLKLLPYQIAYIENDEYSCFNGDLFCKAHLKSYAQLLGLEAEAILNSYQAHFAQGTRALAAKPALTTPIQKPRRGSSVQYWGAAAALVLSISLWMQHESLDEPAISTQQAQQLDAVEVDSNDQSSLMDLGMAANDGSASAESPTELQLDVDLALEAPEQTSVVIDLPSRNNIVSDGAPGGEMNSGIASYDNDELKFEFNEDCWVEVTDGKGDIIFASLKQANDTLKLSGQGPFKVLLGYAHGVSLDYNGEPVEINVKNRNNSARFVVGNIPVQ